MARIPTDYEVLAQIYDSYRESYESYRDDAPNRGSKIFVPIDVAAIARQVRAEPDIVFGRLYYHLEQKHGYVRSDGSKVAFFMLQAGQDRHCVHFPMLASVLAGLQEERDRHRWVVGVAVASLAISIVAIVVSVFY